MPATGYYQQKTGSPSGFALVVLLHAAVFAALILIKGPAINRILHPPTIVTLIPLDRVPDPTPLPQPHASQPLPRDTITQTETVIDTHVTGQTVDLTDHPPVFTDPGPPHATEIASTYVPPVRHEARLIGNDLQPPYPASEQRAQREGVVRLRVTIGSDGRVTAVERLSATSDAFWLATQRQALNRWRFRPATLDGHPVEGSQVMTVQFRLDDQG
jgi:periplasmic protein TonB